MITKHIPNCITLINLLGGIMAIVMALRGNDTIGLFTGLQWSWICIAISAVADFLDGFAARLLKAYSELGKQLDSLCDSVSFGVAPAIMVYHTLLQANGPQWWIWGALFISVCATLRLAKFNIDTRQTESFLGLPVPANAIFWIGYTAIVQAGAVWLAQWWLALPFILAISLLMVGEMPMFSLKFKNFGWKGNRLRWILIASAIVILTLCGVGGLMWLIIFYLFLSALDLVF